MNRLINVAFILIVSTFAAFGAQSENRIFIDPSLKSYDSFPEIKTINKFFVDSLRDTVGSRSDSGIVGYTHTRSKHPTAIVCRPLPTAVVGGSLEKLFAQKGIAATDRGSATYLVRVDILAFNLKETPHFFYQTMDATIQLRITFINPQTAHGFTIDSERSRTTFNANRKSEEILRSALRDALVEVLQSLKGL